MYPRPDPPLRPRGGPTAKPEGRGGGAPRKEQGRLFKLPSSSITPWGSAGLRPARAGTTGAHSPHRPTASHGRAAPPRQGHRPQDGPSEKPQKKVPMSVGDELAFIPHQ